MTHQQGERHDVAAGVMSVSTPGVGFLPPGDAPALARRLNDAAAEVARDHPGRFGNFATLPMQDTNTALAEIAYCLDVLGMDGGLPTAASSMCSPAPTAPNGLTTG